MKKIIKFFKLLKRKIEIFNAEAELKFLLEKIMGFPHCPTCVVPAFVSVFMGVARSYMFYILFREFWRAESNFKLKFSFY